MNLSAEVRERIRRFAADLVTPDELSDWLSGQALAIHRSGDPDARELMDLAFSLLEDVFQDQRSLDDAREALAGVVPMVVSIEGLTTDDLRSVAAPATLLSVTHAVSAATTEHRLEDVYMGDPLPIAVGKPALSSGVRS